MKILVVFGSTSDEKVFNPLVENLSKTFDTEFQVISAHRDLEKLQNKIMTWQGDAIVAGAGLAAALPGVVAAMTRLPVFGVPVAAQFGGLDSVASIAQMPPGVPVITCGPDKTQDIVQFLLQSEGKTFDRVHVVAPTAEMAANKDLLAEIAKVKDTDITVSASPDTERLNLYVVTKTEDIKADAFGLHVPFMNKTDAANPENYIQIVRWMQKGGLWLGVNNFRNAAAAAKRLGHMGVAALPPLLYQGSVKNVRGVAGQAPYIFEFSDRYSIFDWGQMPDTLENKGAALAWMANFFCNYLEKADGWQNWAAPAALAQHPLLTALKKTGAAHHTFGALDAQPRCIAVKPVSVVPPASKKENGQLVWDYTPYTKRPEHTLVPLEVIFRFGVPEGSSLLQRTGDMAYCKTLGLESAPKSGDTFALPLIEFSTKLETSDRYLGYSDAQNIAGLTDSEFDHLATLTKLLALRLKDCFAGIGLQLWDGKLEFAFGQMQEDGNRSFTLVDSIGPDELRLTQDGVHLSKEALRSVYRPLNWYTQLETAKKLAKERGEKDWKKICVEELNALPPTLPPAVRKQAEMIYTGIAKALSQKFDDGTAFTDAWDIADVVTSFKELKKDAA